MHEKVIHSEILAKERGKSMATAMKGYGKAVSYAGTKLYACKATVDMFHLSMDDFCEQTDSIINVGMFYEVAAGGEIIFT